MTEMALEIKEVRFEIGGFFDGTTEILVSYASFDELALSSRKHSMESQQFARVQPKKTWLKFLQAFDDCEITKWEKEYLDPDILDGTQWKIEVRFEDRSPLIISGSNMYPDAWDGFLDAIKILGYDLDEYRVGA